MTEYVNPTGSVLGTAGDDSFVFTAPVANNNGFGITIDAQGGLDSLLFDVDYATGVTVRATGWNGVLNGTIQTGPYDPSLGFYNFEVFEFVGTDHADSFELTLREGHEGLSVDADAGAGEDLLTYDFSNTSAGQSFIVSGGTITSSYAQFAGFERFVITGGSGSDTIQTGAGNDFVSSSGGPNPSSNADTVSTGGGDDRIYATTPGTYDGGDGTDDWTGNFSDAPWAPNTTALTVDLGSTITISNGTTATSVETVSVGTASGDDIYNVARGGYIRLFAGAGSDTLNYTFDTGAAQTFTVEGDNAAVLFGTANELSFSEFEDVVLNGAGHDDSFRLRGLFDADQITLNGGGGTDWLWGEFNSLSGATQFIVAGDGTITSNRGAFVSLERFLLYGGSSADTFTTGAGADSLFGSAGNDALDGGAGNDELWGGTGDDTLSGGNGDDRLNGGEGADAMSGGNGDDTYSVDSVGDVVTELSGQGADTVEASLSYSLGSDFENLTLTGFDAIAGTGNELANRLVGNAAGNVLSGGDGADTLYGAADPYGGGNDWLIGGDGDDVFYAVQGDTITEDVGGGFDRVVSKYDFTLGAGAEVEMLQFEDPTEYWVLSLHGNEFAQTLLGNAGANVLDGGGGNDTLIGGLGNDMLYVDSAGDVVIEAAGGGSDRVYASVSYALGAAAQVEILTTTDNAGTAAINLTGNGFANSITGNNGANVLNGGAGADTLNGLGGNDFLYVDNAGDVVIEAAGGGSDRVYASVSYALGAAAQVEILTTTDNAGTTAINLTGNGFANSIAGNNGVNVLNGGAGADTLNGLGGNDMLYVDNAGDLVIEAAGGGSDRVFASVSYALGAAAQVEVLSTTDYAGTAAINLTGNGFANSIAGNNGTNVLDGGAGADTLNGLGGDDVLHVDSAGDVVIEVAGGGSDRVLASVSYALGASSHVEILTTTDYTGTAAINLTGNGFANRIAGNNGVNVLNGGAGADTLNGMGGNDFFYVDNAGDVIVEAAGGGSDRVYSSVSYALGAAAQVETLSTTDNAGTAAINLTGNGFANSIGGNAGANVLDGLGGSDTLSGLGGADTFRFTTALGAGNVDTISGYSVADDVIHIDNAVFAGLAAGALAAGAFNTGAAAIQADDRIIYNSATGALLFDADGVGGAAAVQFASLSAGLAMTAGEFVVI